MGVPLRDRGIGGCEGGCGTKTGGARTDRKELLGAERTGVPLRVEGMGGRMRN